jgi:hypothetical protein
MPAKFEIFPYGVASLAPDVVRSTVDKYGHHVTCPAPYILVDANSPETLRLNGDQYRFPEPPDLRNMTDASIQMAYLEAHLLGFCDIFSKPQKNFVQRYFTWVAATVEAERAHLTEDLEAFNGIYGYRDWMLSAPRPLPRAQIPYDNGSKFAATDIAFLVGGKPFAIVLDNGQTLTRSTRDNRTALSQTGADMIVVSPSDNLDDVLPDAFQAFWVGQHLPMSPFKGVTLGQIVPA